MRLLLAAAAATELFFSILFALTNSRAMSFATLPGGRGIAGRAFGPIITLPSLRHTATVIMLHGLGDTGNGWAPVAPDLGLHHIKWVFPTAPTRPISVNMGMSMPGWFDIDALDAPKFAAMMKGHHGFDPVGTQESVQYVQDLVQQEVAAGIPHERIVLGGFSQGGHVALRAALSAAPPLAGCVALSTWLEPSPLEIPEANLDLPIFFGHGSADPLIPAAVANATLAVLQARGLRQVAFTMYPGMGHSSCPQELQDLKRFLAKALPDAPPTREDVQSMSARELKQFLQARGASSAGLLEKQELVDKALSML